MNTHKVTVVESALSIALYRYLFVFTIIASNSMILFSHQDLCEIEELQEVYN